MRSGISSTSDHFSAIAAVGTADERQLLEQVNNWNTVRADFADPADKTADSLRLLLLLSVFWGDTPAIQASSRNQLLSQFHPQQRKKAEQEKTKLRRRNASAENPRNLRNPPNPRFRFLAHVCRRHPVTTRGSTPRQSIEASARTTADTRRTFPVRASTGIQKVFDFARILPSRTRMISVSRSKSSPSA